MIQKNIIFFIVLISSFSYLPIAHAEPTVSIIMEKTTYSYCEKLFYTIEVSEITGDTAIIHIRDSVGKGSSAIPIPITGLQNPIPSLVPFEKEIFPLGKYFIDVQYSGAEDTAEFILIDSNKACIPSVIKPIIANWLSGNISDGFLIDSFQKYVENELIEIPFQINDENIYEIDVPTWVKNIGYWWLEGFISDDDFANVINYLIDEKIISLTSEIQNEI